MKIQSSKAIMLLVVIATITVLLVIGTANATVGTSTVPPGLYNQLTTRAQQAYELRMNATVDDNRTRYPQLDTQLAEVYSSNRPDKPSSTLPATRPLSDEQRTKLEDTLRQKGIDPKTYFAEQARIESEIEQIPFMSALERVRAGVQTHWLGPQGDLTVTEAWGLDDFKVVLVKGDADQATVEAQIHMWSRYRHTKLDGTSDIEEPHNGLYHTFYFRKESSVWKVTDWKFEFLPNEGP